MLVWQQYQSDLGRAYPMYALVIRRLNDIDSQLNPVEMLPAAVRSQVIEVNNSCRVDGLTARSLILYLNDGAQFQIFYPEPFNQVLSDYLTLNFNVLAFEFVGERLKYGRMRRLLDNVQS